jgi:hypothetical protein
MSFKLKLGEIELDDTHGNYKIDMYMIVGSDTIYTQHSYIIRFRYIDVKQLMDVISEFKKKIVSNLVCSIH